MWRFLLLVLCISTGCGSDDGQECSKPTDCGKGYTCNESDHSCRTARAIEHCYDSTAKNTRLSIPTQRKSPGGGMTIMQALMTGSSETAAKEKERLNSPDRYQTAGITNVPPSDYGRESWSFTGGGACKIDGECSFEEGRCVALRTEDCMASSRCARYGGCEADDGECIAGSTEDCRASEVCTSDGLCTESNGKCVALGDNCVATDLCKHWGFCSAIDGRCAAQSDADCAGAEICRKKGHCKASDGVCVVGSDGDCQTVFRYLDSEHGDSGCGPTCTFFESQCTPATSKDCLHRDGCRQVGECSLEAGNCVVKTDADCPRSTACTESKRCKALDGVCVEDCATSEKCTLSGLCENDGDRCVATEQAHCDQAKAFKTRTLSAVLMNERCVLNCAETRRACDVLGLCTPTGAPTGPTTLDRVSMGGNHAEFYLRICKATTDADCTNSNQCRDRGRCNLHEGQCIAKSRSDCVKVKYTGKNPTGRSPCRMYRKCTHHGHACEWMASEWE